MSNFILAQLVSACSMVISLTCVQFRDPRCILAGKFCVNVLGAVSFGLLGGRSASWVCVVASIQTVAIFLLNRTDPAKKYRRKLAVSLCFVCVYIVGTILTAQRWTDAITCVCATLYTISIFPEHSGKMRAVIAANMALWLFYDLTVGAYVSLLNHGLSLTSTLTAIFRLDQKRTPAS